MEILGEENATECSLDGCHYLRFNSVFWLPCEGCGVLNMHWGEDIFLDSLPKG